MAKSSKMGIHVKQAERLAMKYVIGFFALTIASVSLIATIWKPQEKLIWNRTHSAPTGLYWMSEEPYAIGDWVIVSARSSEAGWAEMRGYVGRDWPLLKRVSALPGDEVCRENENVSINSRPAAIAKVHDQFGRALPLWSGCVILNEDEIFLLNKHPDSLDGRYFGPTDKVDLIGLAHKVDLF